MSGRLRFAKGLFLFLFAITALGEVPRRAYFPLNEDLAGKLSTAFKVEIKKGLYFSNQWEARLNPDLWASRLDKPVGGFDLTYLRDNAELIRLYGNQAWLGDDDSFQARAGWITALRKGDNKKVRQLWLERKNKERWLLYEYEESKGLSGGYSPDRMMGLPSWFLPVVDGFGHGLIALNSEGTLWRQGGGKSPHDKFEVVRGSKTTQESIDLYQLDYENEEGDAAKHPMLVYNREAFKIFFVAISPEDGTNELLVMDLKKNVIKRVGTFFPEQLHIDLNGVWFEPPKSKRTKTQSLMFRPIRWGIGTLGDRVLVSTKQNEEGRFVFRGHTFFFENEAKKRFRIATNGRELRFHIPDPGFDSITDNAIADTLNDFDNTLQARKIDYSDWMKELRSGQRDPKYFSTKFNDILTQNLGADESTLAIVTYQEGQYPDEVIGAYFWGLDCGVLTPPPALADIEATFTIHGSEFSRVSDDDLKKVIVPMRDLIDGTKTILYLSDFPTGQSFKTAGASAQKRIQTLTQLFSRGFKDGTSRVIISMPKTAFDALKKANAGAFENAVEIPLPRMGEIMRARVARIYALDKEKELVFNERGFQAAMSLARVARENSINPIASPGFENRFLDRVFKWALAEQRRFPEMNLVELNRMQMNRFKAAMEASSSDSNVGAIDFDKMRFYLKRNIAGHHHKKLVDDIVDQVEVRYGDAATGRPPSFVIVGNSGVGKSHIAHLVTKYLHTGGDPKAMVSTSDDNLIIFNMANKSGVTFSINPDSNQAKRLKKIRGGKEAAVFDDLQEAKTNSIGIIGDILEKGYYGRGDSKEQINFGHLGAVFITTTWGGELIDDGQLKSGDFIDNFQDFLMKDENGPQLDRSFWTRISSNLYPLPNLTEWELLDVGFIWARNNRIRKKIETEADVLIDPAVFVYALDIAKANKSQGRGMANELSKTAASYTRLIRNDGVAQVLVSIDSNLKYEAITATDSNFKKRWQEVSDMYSAVEADGIGAFLEHHPVDRIREMYPKFIEQLENE